MTKCIWIFISEVDEAQCIWRLVFGLDERSSVLIILQENFFFTIRPLWLSRHASNALRASGFCEENNLLEFEVNRLTQSSASAENA
jgi:hypothetical protein